MTGRPFRHSWNAGGELQGERKTADAKVTAMSSEAYTPANPLPADKETVPRFLQIISTQAAQASSGLARPGYLQISKVHPADDKLSVSGRFNFADVDSMTAVAIADAEAGHNVYIEARTVRGTTPGRGKTSDTAGVFALVIDSDADTGKAHKPNAKILKPSMIIETSPGNQQDWYFLTQAISAKEAAEIGEAIRRCTGTDHDTGVPTQPYRIAGTPNYPNKTKQSRGRFKVHRTCIIECPGQTYSADELRSAFPKPQTSEKTDKKTDDNVDWRIAEEALPADLKYLIQHGVEEGTRSEQFHHTIGWLKRLGWSAANIVLLLANYPNGIANKFRDRLEREVARSFEKCEGPPRTDHGGDDDKKDLSEMNAKYAVVKVGGKTRVVEFEESPTYLGCKVPVFSTIADFSAFHAKRKKRIPTFKGTKEVGIGKWWIDHPKRQQFERVAYLPGVNDPHLLNLWRGLPSSPRKGTATFISRIYERTSAAITKSTSNICLTGWPMPSNIPVAAVKPPS
jgi:RepB DNA-primase from phage plasmid